MKSLHRFLPDGVLNKTSTKTKIFDANEGGRIYWLVNYNNYFWLITIITFNLLKQPFLG